MQITHLKLKNWKNFRQLEVELRERTYLIGPNASGKSNLLDLFRFLRELAKDGGGIQKAVADRGGIKKLRCLQARKDTEVRMELGLRGGTQAEPEEWTYSLGFKSEGVGRQRVRITTEVVTRNGDSLLLRPDAGDDMDPERLTQTHLEQINSNASFRVLAEFFAGVTYLHLVPQLLKFGDRIGGNRLDEDPFGQGFLERLARTTKRTRDARLNKVQKVLAKAVPQFQELRFELDAINGQPHLEARYAHWRPQGAWHREDQFSDGTLRLIALLWSLLEGDSLLLLEEPELSLNGAIVQQIPLMIERIQRRAKHRRQVLISSHSEALLDNPIDGHSVLLLMPGDDGTQVRAPNAQEIGLLEAGLSPAEVLLPKTRPKALEQLDLPL